MEHVHFKEKRKKKQSVTYVRNPTRRQSESQLESAIVSLSTYNHVISEGRVKVSI